MHAISFENKDILNFGKRNQLSLIKVAINIIQQKRTSVNIKNYYHLVLGQHFPKYTVSKTEAIPLVKGIQIYVFRFFGQALNNTSSLRPE